MVTWKEHLANYLKQNGFSKDYMKKASKTYKKSANVAPKSAKKRKSKRSKKSRRR